jgi:predicted secreted protein
MNIVSAFVMFAVIWFMMLFVILPLRLQSQGEADDVVDGTSPSAPVDPMIGKKVIWITLLTIPIWALVSGIIISGVITVDMFDIYNGIEN